MNSILKNILAVIAGIVVGNIINMSLIYLGPIIIPPPTGVDFTTTEGLKASAHLMETKHFVFPFLAHALGTLVGATVTVLIAASRKLLLAMIVGVFFLLGGIMMVFMIPSPTWFVILDLVGAYIPMAFIATKFKKE